MGGGKSNTHLYENHRRGWGRVDSGSDGQMKYTQHLGNDLTSGYQRIHIKLYPFRGAGIGESFARTI